MKYSLLLFLCLIYCWSQQNLVSTHCEERMHGENKYYNWHYLPRGFWEAKEPRSIEYLNGSDIHYIFIHHTEGRRCNETQDCYRILRSIQNYHMDVRGWNDIGYNFLVDDNGELYEGRSWERVGAHTKGFNNVSVAIALMGNFSEMIPPQDMLETTQCIIKKLRQKYGRGERNITVHGHRDAGCTDCPGDQLYQIIRTWHGFQPGPLPGYRCGD